MIRQKITPFLWFDGKAEEAARFYTSVFPGSEVTGVSPGPDGNPMVVAFKLSGVGFLALNGGPMFKFTEAVSFVVECDSQAEIDTFWAKLSDGGSSGDCGWLKDRYGLSWQVVPAVLPELMAGPPEQAGRVMAAMMTMTKLDIAALRAAADAGPAGVEG